MYTWVSVYASTVRILRFNGFANLSSSRLSTQFSQPYPFQKLLLYTPLSGVNVGFYLTPVFQREFVACSVSLLFHDLMRLVHEGYQNHIQALTQPTMRMCANAKFRLWTYSLRFYQTMNREHHDLLKWTAQLSTVRYTIVGNVSIYTLPQRV